MNIYRLINTKNTYLYVKFMDQKVAFYDYEVSLKMSSNFESDSFSSISFNSVGGTFS